MVSSRTHARHWARRRLGGLEQVDHLLQHSPWCAPSGATHFRPSTSSARRRASTPVAAAAGPQSLDSEGMDSPRRRREYRGTGLYADYRCRRGRRLQDGDHLPYGISAALLVRHASGVILWRVHFESRPGSARRTWLCCTRVARDPGLNVPVAATGPCRLPALESSAGCPSGRTLIVGVSGAVRDHGHTLLPT